MYEFLLRICRRISRLAIALAVLLGNYEVLQAAPVTFQFEAEITGIDDASGGQIDLPIALSIGDQFTGLIEFEPVQFGQHTVTNHLSLDLYGYSLEGISGSLLSYDNQSPTNHSYWVDSLFVSDFQSISSTIPGVVLQALILSVRTSDDLLSTTDSLGDPEAWNQIWPPIQPVGIPAEREFFFELAMPSNLSSLLVTANIGPMRLIPEPSTLMLTIMLLAFGIGFRQKA